MDRHHRINNVPDEIICLILSFLSTKEAALTSLLSKRWRNLFAFTANLDFDDHDDRNPDNYASFGDFDNYDYQNHDNYVSFRDFENYDYQNHVKYRSFRDFDDYEYLDSDNKLIFSDSSKYDYRNNNSFRDFLDRVLTVSCNSPLKKFTLRYQKSVDAALIKRWICNVLSRGVLDLHLDTITKDVITLPLEIFTCKTIVKLKLGGGFCITVPDKASLPALKTLFLDCIQLSSHGGSAFEALISACHVLKELTIHVYASDQWQQCRTFSCPTLKKLTIFCNLWSRFDVSHSHSITFDTPSLTYLDYQGCAADEYQIVNLDSLVEARLSLGSLKSHGESNPMKLIKGLTNVKILNLSSFETSKTLYSFRDANPVFEKLSRLSIATAFGSCWKLLPLLLKKSPNLETLVIKGPLHYYPKETETVCKCLSGYSFLSSCPVKVLEITEYIGTKGDLEQIKHFLEKLPHLEQVNVYTWEKAKFITYLQMLPGASKIQLKFLP